MNKGLRIGRIAGIDLVVDWSWLVIALLVTAAFLGEISTAGSANIGLLMVMAIAGSFLFFGSVVGHELSHSLVAVRLGIRVRRIRLFIFGGVSEIQQEAATAKDELMITVAGPLASFALAGVFTFAWLALLGTTAELRRLAGLLAAINLALGLFNLLPGFPLDGGRVLRSLVWKRSGDYRKATRVAVRGGKLVAAALAALGLIAVLVGDVVGVWYMAIGWFLYNAAAASRSQLEAQERLRDVWVNQVMTPAGAPLSVGTTLSDVPEFDRRAPVPQLVLADDGRIRGLLEAADMRSVPREEWDRWQTGDLMRLIGPDDVIDAGSAMDPLLPRLADRDDSLVVVSGGRVVGTVSRRDVARFLAGTQ